MARGQGDVHGRVAPADWVPLVDPGQQLLADLGGQKLCGALQFVRPGVIDNERQFLTVDAQLLSGALGVVSAAALKMVMNTSG